jgi:hypothetical protein
VPLQLLSASREQVGVELYSVQQQLIALNVRLEACEAQRNEAASARFSAEVELATATRRHNGIAVDTADARELVRGACGRAGGEAGRGAAAVVAHAHAPRAAWVVH